MNTQENRVAQLEKEVEFYKSVYFFLALITHELRTNISPVIGFPLLLLHETSLTEKQKEYVNTLLISGAYPLLEQINKFADFSKLIAERIELEEGFVNLQTVIEKLLERYLPKAKEKGLDLQVLPTPEFHIPFKCDQLRLEQVLDELINNAIRFTQKGKVEITSKLSHAESGQFIDFEVIDTGKGISPEKLAMLSEFFNTSRPTMDPFLVSLGLMNVKLLCNLMKGKISIKSQIDGGSVFRFSLPYEKP